MNTLILISVIPIVLLYLGLYKAKRALLPVSIIGLIVALGLAISQWTKPDVAVPTFHGMLLFNNFSIAFSAITITSTILILLLSKGYFEKISDHIAEYYATQNILFLSFFLSIFLSFFRSFLFYFGFYCFFFLFHLLIYLNISFTHTFFLSFLISLFFLHPILSSAFVFLVSFLCSPNQSSFILLTLIKVRRD